MQDGPEEGSEGSFGVQGKVGGMTGGDVVVRTLLQQGVGTAFGIPGALNAHLYDALLRPGPDGQLLRHILVRNELGGAWMADGWARASNDVGVAFTVPGPGASHAVSAVAGAYTECSRLLLVTSQSESQWRGELRRDLFHGLNQERLFAPITRWNARVERADEIGEVLREAFRVLRTGRPGPVHVEIPADVLGHRVGLPCPAGRIQPVRRQPAPGEALRAAALLREARRPLILAGDGVIHSGAEWELARLASVLRAPVITTVLGKGALDERHPWSLGDSNSVVGSQAYGEHDLLLAAGVRFVQTDTRWGWFTPPRRLVHVDADARELGRVFPAEAALWADPGLLLSELADHLTQNPGDRSGWDQLLPQIRAAHPPGARHPLLRTLAEALPTEVRAVFDVCVPGFHSRTEWPVTGPAACLYPGVYVGMGFGLPVGIGAQLATPLRPVCVIAGDGGFQMTLQELGTVAQYGIPLLVVVANDAGLTLIRRVQDRDFGGRRSEVELRNPDFAALAGSYGIEANATRELDEVAQMAKSWAASPRPLLVEWRTEPT